MGTVTSLVPTGKQSPRLPANYEAAKAAIVACDRIDEAADWANKTAAVAAYAEMAGDQTLKKSAERIQARAMRRCGELLQEIPKSPGGRPPKTQGDAPPSLTPRQEAARTAGLSDDKVKEALRVAAVPAEEFEAAVESDDPPSVAELAERGTKKRKVAPGPEELREEARRGIAAMDRFEAFAAERDPTRIVAGATEDERKRLLQQAGAIEVWLRWLVKAMEG